MTSRARLLTAREPADPAGVVLVLHGGATRREARMVSPAQLSVLRMLPVARRMAAAGRGRLAVHRLLNSARGWDTAHTPVDDVEWALRELSDRYGDLPPVALVGHSLGGRAALLSAGRPEVRSVVALNPWVHPADGDVDAQGHQVLVVHGSEDRVALPERAMAAARRLSRTGRVGFVSVEGGRHAMLRHGALFERYATDFVVATLLDVPPPGPLGAVLDGAWMEV